MELDINQIKEILPHRYPFLLVDRITHLEPGVRAVGRKCVSGNEAFFQGHFPQKPVMPGVLIIEAMAQVGAVILLCEEEYKGRIALFGGIKKARFKRQGMCWSWSAFSPRSGARWASARPRPRWTASWPPQQNFSSLWNKAH